LLFTLYRSPIGTKVIPSSLLHHFDGTSLEKHTFPSNCLVGLDKTDEPGVLYLCLSFSMTVHSNNEHDIILEKVSYNRNQIDSNVHLFASEAFFILANICVEQVFPTLCLANRISTITTNFSKDSLSKLEDNPHYKHMRPLFHFVAGYIEFVQELIMSDSLSPAELLRLGGISSLMLLLDLKSVDDYVNFVLKQVKNNMQNLTFQDRIQYFSLTRCLYTEARTRFPILYQIFKQNKEMLNIRDSNFLYE